MQNKTKEIRQNLKRLSNVKKIDLIPLQYVSCSTLISFAESTINRNKAMDGNFQRMFYHGAFIKKVIRTAVNAAIHARMTTPATIIPMITTLLGGVPVDLISLIGSLRNNKLCFQSYPQ